MTGTENAVKQAWQHTHVISYYQEANPEFIALLASIENYNKQKSKRLPPKNRLIILL